MLPLQLVRGELGPEPCKFGSGALKHSAQLEAVGRKGEKGREREGGKEGHRKREVLNSGLGIWLNVKQKIRLARTVFGIH